MEGVGITACSRVYRTQPQEIPDQPWFANQVVQLACRADMAPQDLLTALHAVEASQGRDRARESVRYGQRIIDLDLLLFHDAILDTPGLTLPHPRMKKRAFVLVPLQEIAPELVFPDGDSLRAALSRLPYRVGEGKIWQAAECEKIQ